jgi:transcriptional regulator with XRE-family HTH domain
MLRGDSFGERIRNARADKHLKQSDIAKEMGCAPTSLTNYESGKIKPPFDILARLCEVLQISALDLLDKAYTYSDIIKIANTPDFERSYEDKVALNFSGALLERAQEKEIKRVEKERENRNYISTSTGLTPAAVDALTADIDTLLGDDSKVSPVALEGLNRLLTSPQGLQALENIAVYLRSGDYRFADGAKVVTVNVGSFSANGSTINKSLSFTPDMVGSIARNELLKNLDSIKTRIPQEEIDIALECFNNEKAVLAVAKRDNTQPLQAQTVHVHQEASEPQPPIRVIVKQEKSEPKEVKCVINYREEGK